MQVILLHSTPLWINAHGARTCWDSSDKSDTIDMNVCADCEYQTDLDDDDILECPMCGSSFFTQKTICGPADMELIDRVGNKFRHASILEHVSYNFSIEEVSRALLQELARHRIASLSVKSTRYTLKELKEEESFVRGINGYHEYDIERAKKYLVFPPHAQQYDLVWQCQVRQLDMLRELLSNGKDSNDVLKYCLVESYKTSLTWSINMRSLQNFLSLRSDKSALWEIQNLAHAIYNALPSDHRYLYENHIKEHHE